jgi:hypothetical protein
LENRRGQNRFCPEVVEGDGTWVGERGGGANAKLIFVETVSGIQGGR